MGSLVCLEAEIRGNTATQATIVLNQSHHLAAELTDSS